LSPGRQKLCPDHSVRDNFTIAGGMLLCTLDTQSLPSNSVFLATNSSFDSMPL
jgi:hypothetical protein